MSMQNISDEKLYALCKMYGAQALRARQKFIGLLPEVFKRKLYEKKGFGSVFEFAFKLCGLSEEQVRRVLNLEKRFQDKALLHKALVGGEVSMNKLAKIAAVATVENQDFLLNQSKLLSTRALEVLVKDEKMVRGQNGEVEWATKEGAIVESGIAEGLNGLQKLPFEGESVHVNTNLKQNIEKASGAVKQVDLEISENTKQRLLELQQKGIDVDALLNEFLDKREEEIAQEKQQLATEVSPVKSRYIKVEVKKLITQEFGTKCAAPNCNKLSEQLHHADRFSMSHQHNPYFLAPLCKEHHQIAHSIDVKYVEMRRQKT